MSRRYFDLSQDVQIPGRWYLGDPAELSGQELEDPWVFTDGRPAQVEGRIKVPVYQPGKPLDFSLAGVSVTPVVHAKVATLFTDLAPHDVQVIPVVVDSQEEPFFILVATRLIRCIDDRRSTEVLYWKPEDGRQEKVGQYRDVYGMRIDPEKVGDAKVFRTWGWTVALIVSEEIKEALERIGATGTKFEEV
jgi:hypothetical protein